VSKGCCWLPVERHSPPVVEQPWCFYNNTGRSEYKLSEAHETGKQSGHTPCVVSGVLGVNWC